jgi:drug/metabolite transporter (DMT)-like permease
MNWRFLSLLLIVAGVLLYHVSQKSIPKHVNPIVAFTAAYAIAFLICFTILVASGELKNSIEIIRNGDWIPILFLGLSLIPVELGFLYAYRSGLKISTTSITTGPFITIALAFIGTLWYKEELSLTNMIGIGLCLAGVLCVQIE